MYQLHCKDRLRQVQMHRLYATLDLIFLSDYSQSTLNSLDKCGHLVCEEPH